MEDKELVRGLNAIQPKLKMYTEGFEFNDSKDFCPPIDLEWIEFIKILREHGYDIILKKD